MEFSCSTANKHGYPLNLILLVSCVLGGLLEKIVSNVSFLLFKTQISAWIL